MLKRLKLKQNRLKVPLKAYAVETSLIFPIYPIYFSSVKNVLNANIKNLDRNSMINPSFLNLINLKPDSVLVIHNT